MLPTYLCLSRLLVNVDWERPDLRLRLICERSGVLLASLPSRLINVSLWRREPKLNGLIKRLLI